MLWENGVSPGKYLSLANHLLLFFTGGSNTDVISCEALTPLNLQTVCFCLTTAAGETRAADGVCVRSHPVLLMRRERITALVRPAEASRTAFQRFKRCLYGLSGSSASGDLAGKLWAHFWLLSGETVRVPLREIEVLTQQWWLLLNPPININTCPPTALCCSPNFLKGISSEPTRATNSLWSQ